MSLREETSSYLDLIRLAAVAMVFMHHATRPVLTGGFLRPLGGYGQEGVAIFFVISGLMIAHVSATRERCLRSFAVARLSRLWSVAIPAILLTVTLDLAGARIAPDLYRTEGLPPLWSPGWASAWQAMSPALFLNSVPGFAVEVGTNGPFWSLSYEAWYYAAFALAWFLRGWWRLVGLAAVAGFVGWPILGLAPIWLMGVGTYRLLGRSGTSALACGVWLATIAAIPTWMVFKYAILRGIEAQFGPPGAWETMLYAGVEKYVPAMALCVNILAFDCLARHFRWLPALCSGWVQMLVRRSFSIYLYQAPLLFFTSAVARGIEAQPLRILLVYVGTLGLAMLLAEFTERRRHVLARWLSAAMRFVAPAAMAPRRGLGPTA